ncbi:MAG: L-fuculose kinase [Curvibacter sp.]|nr:L-fuculose kinase [Curvibacter sp.]
MRPEPRPRKNRHVAILDIGKTNLKFSVHGEGGEPLYEQRCSNLVHPGAPYPHFAVDDVWHWILSALKSSPEPAAIEAIVCVTHGACAALLADDGLALPVLDYEHAAVHETDAAYEAWRDDFSQTLSPALPAGLNLGRQLFWQSQCFPAAWRRVRWVLTYPQYWAWRLGGVAASERTSLACHTDLWRPPADDFSALVDRAGWRPLFPPLRWAGDTLATLRPELARNTGLPPGCRVLCGIHDSNASMVKLKQAGLSPVSLVSSGTWVLVSSPSAALACIDPARDMLANVDAWGRPYACARFMGGREFAHLNRRGAADADASDVAALLAGGTRALPSFSPLGGAYAGQIGRIEGPVPANAAQDHALASLYLALLTDDALDRLGVQEPVLIEGRLSGNRLYAGLLASLKPMQPVWVSDDLSGTSGGAFLLARPDVRWALQRREAAALDLPQLPAYRQAWRSALGAFGGIAIR